MRLQEVLNKFTNTSFLLSVEGWCDELPFDEYEQEKKQDYWKKYRDRKVLSMALITTNDQPELCIHIAPDECHP
jgi:vacuolar-type H+-ATPase subunit I/STV1